MEYKVKVIRSARRKSCQLSIDMDGTVLVRIPSWDSDAHVRAMLAENREWIDRQLKEVEKARESKVVITPQMREEGIKKAMEVFPERTAYYAKKMGCEHVYGRITIREQKTRWGSCSSNRNLNFNWKLVLLPEEVLDYVVVHELAHLFEMNHSKAFWAIVERVLPDYKERRELLKQLGKRFQ